MAVVEVRATVVLKCPHGFILFACDEKKGLIPIIGHNCPSDVEHWGEGDAILTRLRTLGPWR